MTNDLLFQAWLIANNFDQQVWQAGLLRMLRARYERSQEKIVIDGRDCQWPTRTYRVNQNENTPGD
jgi:hypothetical protein